MWHYIENINEFKNAIVSDNKNKIKYEEFNKWMACLLIANSYQSKYVSLENGLSSQYLMKNNQYLKDIISAAYVVKNHWHDDSGTRKT